MKIKNLRNEKRKSNHYDNAKCQCNALKVGNKLKNSQNNNDYNSFINQSMNSTARVLASIKHLSTLKNKVKLLVAQDMTHQVMNDTSDNKFSMNYKHCKKNFEEPLSRRKKEVFMIEWKSTAVLKIPHLSKNL